jgi:ATP-dependent Clp protease ATP-binding subunit ClpA
MKACKVDPGVLKEELASYVDNELKALVADFDGEPSPTPAFQRVVQRAVLHAQSLGRDTVTGADLLVAMFDEKESPALWFLSEQEMSQQDAANFILHGIVKGSGDRAV